MYADERHSQIVTLARGEGRVEVNALAQRFAITTETVRRDLERRGLLRRVHGGALPMERVGIEPTVSEREIRDGAEKVRIGRADAWALRSLADVRVEIAFVATNGVAVDAGLTTPDFAVPAAAVRRLTSAGPQVECV